MLTRVPLTAAISQQDELGDADIDQLVNAADNVLDVPPVDGEHISSEAADLILAAADALIARSTPPASPSKGVSTQHALGGSSISSAAEHVARDAKQPSVEDETEQLSRT